MTCINEEAVAHARRHRELHQKLDELVTHYLLSNPRSSPAEVTILELILWSGKQIHTPDHIHECKENPSFLKKLLTIKGG